VITNLEAVVLGIICEKPSYGYEIEATIQDRSIRLWTDIAFSSIYYVLRRLEKQGLIDSTRDEVDGRLRKIYRATPHGEKMMAARLGESLSTLEKPLSAFNLGVGFMGRLGLTQSLDYLEQRKKTIKERLDSYRDALQVIEARGWPFFIKALYTRPITLLEAEEAWLDGFIVEIRHHEQLKKNKPPSAD